MQVTGSNFSPHYKKELSHTYILSIQIRLDGLSFSVYDPVKNEVLIVGNNACERDIYYGSQEEFFLREPLFHLPYRGTIITLTDLDFTLIPTTLFDPQKSKDLLKFAGFSVEKDASFLSDNLSMASAMLVYSMPSFLYYFLKSEVKNLTLIHQATSIANSLLLKRLEGYDTRVAVHFTSEKMMVVVVKNNLLKLCNTFNYTDENDATYIILNIAQQMNIGQKSSIIELSGDISEVDRRKKMLEKFAPNVVLKNEPKWFDYGVKIDEIWRYADMLNLMLCV